MSNRNSFEGFATRASSAAGSRKHRVLAGTMAGKAVRFEVTGQRALGLLTVLGGQTVANPQEG